jgi:hypothetical protein
MRGGMAAEVGVPLGVFLDRQVLPEEMPERVIQCAARKTHVGRETQLGQDADQLRIEA